MKDLGENVHTDGLLNVLGNVLRFRGIQVRSASRHGKGKEVTETGGQ